MWPMCTRVWIMDELNSIKNGLKLNETHPICVFILLVDDTHIIGFTLVLVFYFYFLWLQYEFSTLKLSM